MSCIIDDDVYLNVGELECDLLDRIDAILKRNGIPLQVFQEIAIAVDDAIATALSLDPEDPNPTKLTLLEN